MLQKLFSLLYFPSYIFNISVPKVLEEIFVADNAKKIYGLKICPFLPFLSFLPSFHSVHLAFHSQKCLDLDNKFYSHQKAT